MIDVIQNNNNNDNKHKKALPKTHTHQPPQNPKTHKKRTTKKTETDLELALPRVVLEVQLSLDRRAVHDEEPAALVALVGGGPTEGALAPAELDGLAGELHLGEEAEPGLGLVGVGDCNCGVWMIGMAGGECDVVV